MPSGPKVPYTATEVPANGVIWDDRKIARAKIGSLTIEDKGCGGSCRACSMSRVVILMHGTLYSPGALIDETGSTRVVVDNDDARRIEGQRHGENEGRTREEGCPARTG